MDGSTEESMRGYQWRAFIRFPTTEYEMSIGDRVMSVMMRHAVLHTQNVQ